MGRSGSGRCGVLGAAIEGTPRGPAGWAAGRHWCCGWLGGAVGAVGAGSAQMRWSRDDQSAHRLSRSSHASRPPCHSHMHTHAGLREPYRVPGVGHPLPQDLPGHTRGAGRPQPARHQRLPGGRRGSRGHQPKLSRTHCKRARRRRAGGRGAEGLRGKGPTRGWRGGGADGEEGQSNN